MKKGLQSGDKQFSLMLLSPAVIITVIFRLWILFIEAFLITK